METFYVIMNGCETGKEYSRKELRQFLFQNKYTMSDTDIPKQFIIIDIYNKCVGDCMKIEE